MVRHEDTEGNALTTDTTTLGNPSLTNEAYSTSQSTFTGYTFKEMKADSDSVTGVYEAGKTKIVTYVYKKDAGTLIVRYEDETGNLIEPETSVSKPVGETYTTTKKVFTGYTFKEVKTGSAATSGNYEKDVTKTVTYVYKRDIGTVIVRHEDEAGNLLDLEEQTTKETGSIYTTGHKEFTGYTFFKMKQGSAETSGYYEKDITKVVTYVYKKADSKEPPKTVTFKPNSVNPNATGNTKNIVNTNDITEFNQYYILLFISSSTLYFINRRSKRVI
ncbi:MAG: MucBP domain-containing protein [Coprobacillaceae bacterium]